MRLVAIVALFSTAENRRRSVDKCATIATSPISNRIPLPVGPSTGAACWARPSGPPIWPAHRVSPHRVRPTITEAVRPGPPTGSVPRYGSATSARQTPGLVEVVARDDLPCGASRPVTAHRSILAWLSTIAEVRIPQNSYPYWCAAT